MAIPHDKPFSHMPDERSGSIPSRQELSGAQGIRPSPLLAGGKESRFEEVASKLASDIKQLDQEVCALRDHLQPLLTPHAPTPQPQVLAGAAKESESPIVDQMQARIRQVDEIRYTIADILNRLEI